MKKIIAFIIAVLTVLSLVACATTGNVDTDETTNNGGNGENGGSTDTTENVFINQSDIDATKVWLEKKIEDNELFNFRYDGKAYSSFIDDWEKKVETSVNEDGNTNYIVTYTDNKVIATIDIILYKDYPAVDWVCYFENTSNYDSKVISDIQALYTYFDIENPVLGYANGSDASEYDFAPQTYDFKSGDSKRLTCNYGRSSQGMMPYFDLSNGEKGVVGAIGWTGQWTCDVKKISDSVKVTAGMTKTKIALKGKESMRTPSIVLVFFTGDCDYGHNVFRRLLLNDYTAKDENGEVVTSLPLTINNWGSDGDYKILSKMEMADNVGFAYDVLWVDAGWHGNKASADTYDFEWAKQVGNWYVNTSIYSDGFKEISDELAASGKELLVWFEPERVYPGTDIYTNYRKYVIVQTEGHAGLYNFADDEAAEYMTNLIVNLLKENGISWYRQDFNIDPLSYWEYNDRKVEGSNRTGITEIKYITNLYKFIDTLETEIPGLMMDNCASGGKRLDIEMMKRSFPLWRSDYYCSGADVTTNSEACRAIGYNLSYWIPLSCGGQSSSGISNTYDWRCVLGSGITMGVPSTSLKWWERRISEYKNLRDNYLTTDYYILTQGDTAHYRNKMAVYEYYSPEKGTGCILAFRSTATIINNVKVDLKGLDPDATYRFTCADNGETGELDGYSLMNGGFTVNMKTKGTSVLIYFEKVN